MSTLHRALRFHHDHDHDGHGQAEGSCCGGKGGGGCCGGSNRAGLYDAAPKDATREQIEALDIPTLSRRYAHGVENFDMRVFELSDPQLDLAFLADAGVGTWPIRVLLGHIADAELAYSHRMRRAVAELNPVLSVWDENAFIDQNLYGLARSGDDAAPEFSAPGATIAVTHVLRRWTADWLRTLEPQAWQRTALHPERGPESLKRMVAMATWHLEHHARFLARKLDRICGPLETSGCCGGGGKKGGCGCKH